MIADLSHKEKITAASLFPVGYNYSVQLDKWNLSDQACDYIYTKDKVLDFEIPGTLGVIVDQTSWLKHTKKDRHYPLYPSFENFLQSEKSAELNFVQVDIATLFKEGSSIFSALSQKCGLCF